MNRLAYIGAAAAVLIIAAHACRNYVARSRPGLVSYYSIYPSPFSYSTKYHTGEVGPFAIGSSKNSSMHQLEDFGQNFRLPMPLSIEDREDLYFKENRHLSERARTILYREDIWRIALRQHGSTVVYRLTFSNDRLQQINLTSTLIS